MASTLAFRHVVLDLDGTLVDTKDDLAAAVNVALGALGLPPQDPRTLLGYVGNGARVLLERALGAAHGDRIDAGLDVFMPWYRAHLLDHAVVYAGLRAALERLAAEGAVFSVLTNKPADMSAKILAGLDLEALCPRLIAGDTLPVRKPDPAGLVQLVVAAGVPPTATLMVGDSAVDVATGRNAAIATCAVLWGFNGAAVRGAGADAEIATPAELVALCRDGLR
ncbi:MAG: HAD hydrolase-like protein [Deltaproteobacteria bacterium]|nr:HAD hydrolase-like protein [Deltaproteobacteria bacterium]